MSPNLQRAVLLLQQSRPELAEAELRQVLAEDPNDAYAHALMGLCLARREQFKPATQEAQQAVQLAPDFPFAHYVLASVFHQRDRNKEALAAIHEALRLDSAEPDYYALLAAIQLDERRWPAALEAAERGLRLDSEHVTCTNLRAVALVKLGRKAEAGATIEAALARDPGNSVTHANQGWTLLERGDPKKALEHFREALRLNPENEWARRGIIEALKARHLIYALMLRYFLFMGKLGPRGQWGIILGGYLAIRLLGGLAQTDPSLKPWILPVMILYVTFALMTWVADPVFNLLLRLNRFGRLALTRDRTVASNWIGSCLLLAVLALGGCFFYGFDSPCIVAALVFGVMVLPLAGTFKCQPGWPRTTMAIYTGVTAAVGLAATGLLVVAETLPAASAKSMAHLAATLVFAFVIGAIGSSWLANILIMQRRRR